MTTGMTFTTGSATTYSHDCTSSMKIPGPSGHYGNTKTAGDYAIETANTLFLTEFWDDEAYEIVPNNVDALAVTLATFGDED